MGNTNWNVNPWDIWTNSLDDPSAVTVTHHVIQGDMLTVSLTMSQIQEIIDNDIANSEMYIKQRMASLIAEELLRSKHISFTKKKDLVGVTHYLARAFVVPSGDVQLLRQFK